MIVWQESFEQFFGYTNLLAPLAEFGYTATGSPKLVSGYKNIGNALQLPANSQLRMDMKTDRPLFTFGMAIRIDDAAIAGSEILNVNQGAISIVWDRELVVNGNRGGMVVITGSFFYIEIRHDKFTGETKTFLNNSEDAGAVIPGGLVGTVHSLVINQGVSIDNFYFVDDLAGDGIRHTDRLGPQKMDLRIPTGDMLTNFDSQPEGAHYNIVRNRPPVNGYFISSNNAGDVDLFSSNSPMTSVGDVTSVSVIVRAKKTHDDERRLGIVYGTSSVSRDIVDTEIDVAEKLYQGIFEVTPDGQPLTTSNLAMEGFGVTVSN